MQMFGEGGAAVGGTGLVPTRFVWPHGGRKVFLCGDFTRFLLPLSSPAPSHKLNALS